MFDQVDACSPKGDLIYSIERHMLTKDTIPMSKGFDTRIKGRTFQKVTTKGWGFLII